MMKLKMLFIAEPDDGKHYIWNEALYQSDNSLGWEEE